MRTAPGRERGWISGCSFPTSRPCRRAASSAIKPIRSCVLGRALRRRSKPWHVSSIPNVFNRAAGERMSEAYLTWRRFVRVNAILLLILLGSVVLASLIGSVHIDLRRALQSGVAPNVDRVILFHTRLPRVLLASVVGAALATAGVALQGLLR